ncbi:spinocerebellar ataxia type 10 protein domain-containing protein [Irpex rosettiformis]|uniref:Spinocerebellar ataxia type 10 protein domain-containing protein n=1 Tax=Irpex rosettiformis TaxID=378272 RepID=A0ACB8TR10_9APHY|nr:spinocerebellar ataxia type 10 protein domain-containing protein [Irpex rosettiformis]
METLRSLCLSLAKFTRNLVAAVPENQSQAYENEPSIRQLLRHYTSYTEISKGESYTATRILTQTLANIVTSNEDLIEKLWNSYLRRVISTPDAGTALASFVLILNCLHGSLPRMAFLTTSLSGPRLCITYLDRMASLFDAADGESTGAFEIGYRIFSDWVEGDLIPAIYTRIGIAEEVVTPHHTTLLKLLDAYLQPSNRGHINASRQCLWRLCEMTTTVFFSLGDYTQQSIQRALGSYKTQQLEELDLLLPKVCEALVLVTQCLISLTLFSEEEFVFCYLCSPTYRAPSTEHVSFLPETLRLLDRFLPRIALGKVAPPPAADPKGFSYLKRDLVRLLGILVADRPAVQDRTRNCGGIPVILNLCVMDDRNPYLREHAIFALRNLLHGNLENQALVKEIQPLEDWENPIVG